MFNVHMPSEALTELHGAWLESCATTRVALEAALAVLWSRLRTDPGGLGESRGSDHQRIAFGHGLAALYEVDAQGRLVSVLRAWPFRRPG